MPRWPPRSAAYVSLIAARLCDGSQNRLAQRFRPVVLSAWGITSCQKNPEARTPDIALHSPVANSSSKTLPVRHPSDEGEGDYRNLIFFVKGRQDVDGRIKSGHDGKSKQSTGTCCRYRMVPPPRRHGRIESGHPRLPRSERAVSPSSWEKRAAKLADGRLPMRFMSSARMRSQQSVSRNRSCRYEIPASNAIRRRPLPNSQQASHKAGSAPRRYIRAPGS